MTSSNFTLFIFIHILYLSAYSSSFSAGTYSDNIVFCQPQQHLALLRFKQEFIVLNDVNYNDMECELEFGSYPKMMTWNASTNCCRWDGVTCDLLTGDIIGLDLRCSKLQGTIDSNSSLFNIPRLRSLNLAFNDLRSSIIPPEIGRFASSLTHLNLSSSSFSGDLPSEILHLSKLVSLDLSYNHFDSVPPHFLIKLFKNTTRLRELSLTHINISSTLPSILSSSSLTSLDLSETYLHGDLPVDILDLPNLQKLDLSLNAALTGTLPEVNRRRNIPLRMLDLSQTGITGNIPDSIANLRSLEVLILCECDLSGFLPKSLGNLSHLVTLDIVSTNVGGIIPSSITSLTHLVTLDLSDNSLTGLPASSNITGLRKLVHIYLYSNLLEGVISSWFSLPTSLKNIDLSSNMLSGVIPSGLFEISSLEALDLSYNKLEGTIPSVFTLTSLTVFMLNDNQLVGQLDLLDEDLIPRSFLKLVNVTHIILANNNFSGVWGLDLLLSSLTNLQALDLSYSGLSVVTTNANHSVIPEMQILSLASCKLTSFPKFLRSTKELTGLDISHNDIHGQLPSWIGEVWMNSLSTLDLSHNFITGLHLPPWKSLKFLKLDSNFIEGQFPLSICKMSYIQFVDLSNNNFNGTIPNCFGSINKGLVMVDLRNNAFHGTFPMISGCEQLGELNLNKNQLHGKLPRSLAKCVSLEVLDLGNNQFEDEFPNWLATLPILRVLVLRSNNFHGSITTSGMTDFQFSNLRILDLAQNKFSGTLPSMYFRNLKAMMNVGEEVTKNKYASPFGYNIYYHTTVVIKGMSYDLVRILTTLTAIDLSDNIFEGSIPDIIGSLKSLKVLNLSHNSLTGHIPYALGNLSNIESLDLSWNQLVGQIHQQLTVLTFLEVLNLSQNHLEGRIPQERQFNTFDKNSFLGNPGLCGLPLTTKCENNHETNQSSGRLEDSQDTESGFTWKEVTLGYGCGTLLGMVMGYLMLLTRKPKWFNRIADAAEHIVNKRGNKIRYVYIGK